MYTKKAVAFEHPGMGHDKCAVCVHFVPGENRCAIVSGVVLAQDWCNKFKQGAPVANEEMHEHDTIRSRTTGRKQEISMGMHGDGLVPSNPFASQDQRKFMFANKAKMESQGVNVDEWARASKGKKLPKKVK